MASEVNMSLDKYEEIRKILTPKHIQIRKLCRKRKVRRDNIEGKESDAEPNMFLRPLKDIEMIMQQFREKFGAAPQRRKIESRTTSLPHIDQSSIRAQNRATLKRVRRSANKYKESLSMECANQINRRKSQINSIFCNYLVNQLKINPTRADKKRFATIQ